MPRTLDKRILIVTWRVCPGPTASTSSSANKRKLVPSSRAGLAARELLMLNLLRSNTKKFLYELHSVRVASMRSLLFDPTRDGATNFETK